MNTPDKEVLVVSDEDEQEYLTDEIVLHNERKYLARLTNPEDAECVKAFYTDTDEILETMLLLVCELFSGKKIPVKNGGNELDREVELQLVICKKKAV